MRTDRTNFIPSTADLGGNDDLLLCNFGSKTSSLPYIVIILLCIVFENDPFRLLEVNGYVEKYS